MTFGRLYSCSQVDRAILAGLLGAALLVLAGCVGAPKLPDEPSSISHAQINDEKSARDAWRASQVKKYSEVWTRENGPGGDPYVAGQAAYYLALATFESEWSKAAISSFEQALNSELPFPDRARAGLGGANRLAARDYPISGIAQFLFFGVPGILRSNHIRISISNLNRAVEDSPNDPLVLLPRAAAFVGIPKFFGIRKTGLSDYEMLEQWTQQPETNLEYFDLLSSEAWRDEYYLMRAQSMEQAGIRPESTKAWRLLFTNANDPYLQALASYRLAN